jgi:uncharacterized damage-inducible protein DinB
VNPVVRPLVATLELNTRLLLNALDGIDEEGARKRPNERTNHVLFIACHLVDARHYLARSLGLPSESPFKAMLDGAKGIDDVKQFPPLEEVRRAWKDVGERLSSFIAELEDSDLEKPAPFAFPIEGGGTTLGCLAFLVQHDSYHLGQVAFLRRYLGLDAMSYK